MKIGIQKWQQDTEHPSSLRGATNKLKTATKVTIFKLLMLYFFKYNMTMRIGPENISS